jgi:hypothetical protein
MREGSTLAVEAAGMRAFFFFPFFFIASFKMVAGMPREGAH